MVKRAAPEHKGNKQERTKRTKYDPASNSPSGKFIDVGDIRAALASPDSGFLTQALTTLRNQLTIRLNEPALTPQDERLLLAKSWFDASPGARDIFSIMDRSPQPGPSMTSLCLAVLSSVLNLFSTHFIYHSLGEPVIKSLLSPSSMRRLNLNLTNASSELILSTLKVFNAMSTYAGNADQRSIMDGFSWGQKSLHKLLFLRRKGKSSNEVGSNSKPDIRTLYIFFILSFLSTSTPTPIKLSLLEQHRDVFLLIFKGLWQDPYPVARRVLEVCWEGVWNDPKIKRTLKIGLFSEQTINHILKLYARESPEDDKNDHIPADLVHHFMLALTTRPGIGICFKDRGWYPREHVIEEGAIKSDEVDGDEFSTAHGGKINNKILANIVKGLKVNEDVRQQELAFKILEACPELVAGYWGAANLTLEPRLSSRWITNIAVFGTIISLPIPTYCFLLPHTTQHNPSPPPLVSTLANVLPSVVAKTHFTKGLQSPSRLVQHCTALALAKCLSKLHGVLTAFQEAARQLEEDDETGQWSKRWREVEAEAEKRVPDFMVIIAMIQQKYPDASGEQDSAKAVLLTESALRLLWLYHKLFPRLIAEVRFDVGKLLLSVVDSKSDASRENDEMDTDGLSVQESQSGMGILRQLHVLRLLRDSDQFAWSNKSGPSSRSYLHVILTLYTKTPHPAVRTATSDLLSHLLSSSLLFSHDPAELILWLGALPLTRRAPHAAAPDGTPLSDESTGVLIFLDDCIQRCTKTPYRYLEESISFFSDTASDDFGPEESALSRDDQNKAPSPLLMTLLEQLRAKIIGNLISPSDTLAIVTFIRKLICSMSCKLSALRSSWKLQKRLQEICLLQSVAPDASTLQDAIKRECELLSSILGFIEHPSVQPPVTSGPAVQIFLEQVENLPTPPSSNAASDAAYELVDWMRLIHPALHPDDVKRLMLAIFRFSPSAVKEFVYQLDPRQGHLWYSIESHLKEVETQLPFEWAYLHATPAQIAQTPIKDCLVSLFFSEAAWSKSFEYRLSVIMQRLIARMTGNARISSLRHPEISLITSILDRSHSRSTKADREELKKIIFVQSRPIRELCCSPDISSADLEDLAVLVRTCLDPQSASDKTLALEYCNFWVAHSRRESDLRSCVLASPWIRFMDPAGVIQYLDVVISSVQGGYELSATDKNAAVCILHSLSLFRTTPALLEDLQGRSRGLLVLRPHLDQSSTLDALLLLIVESGLPLGYDALPLGLNTPLTLSDVSLVAQERWKNRAGRLPLCSVLTTEFLQSEDWTTITARIVSGAMYQSLAARRNFSVWLTQTEPHHGPSLGIVAVALRAFLDISLQGDGAVTQSQLPDPWFLALIQHLLLNQDTHEGLSVCASCIRAMVEALPSRRAHYANHMLKEARSTPSGVISSPFLLLIRDLYQMDATSFSDLGDECSDEALKWLAGQFSEGLQSDDDLSLVEQMVSVISRKETKTHLVEPVLRAAIQSSFHVPRLIQCTIPIVLSTSLKPAIVNRLLQSIVQHFQLFRLTDASLSTRAPIIRLLHTLFYLHPTNTCQPSHVAPLTRLYNGTLSYPDRLLFSIFYLYEKQRKESAASIFHHWSPSSSGSPAQDAFGAITSLDPTKVLRTCIVYPTRRTLDATVVAENGIKGDDGEYDPVFLTLLLAQLLAERKELSTTDWVQLFRSNTVSVVMCVLTSRDEALRNVGVSTLAGMFRKIQGADFLERDQVIYIMDMLRDLLPSPSHPPSASTPRLPTYPVMVLAHALRSTFYPSSFLYPIISRFLLQRPELDITDVPMLYSLLYSSEDGGDWTRERTWMIRFLTESIREGGARDWAVLKRRHTWELVASMWQAARKDERSLRRGVLEFLANLSANPHAIMSLVLRSALLSWIELQLQTRTTHEGENIAFVKILENILVTADVDRANKAMHGEFDAIVARCLNAVLRDIKHSDGVNSLTLLHLISRVIFRMASRPYPHAAVLGDVQRHTIEILRNVESSISWKTVAPACVLPKASLLPEPPHYARGLFDILTMGDSIEVWSECVCVLWRVSMGLTEWPGDGECWEALTCRLLVIRAWGSGELDLGEWARRQTVRCLLESVGKE